MDHNTYTYNEARIRARDSAMRLLNRLTAGAAFTAIGGVAILGAVSANTNPGTTSSTATTATTSTTSTSSSSSPTSSTSSSSSGVQSSSTPVSSSSSLGVVVSGGSH